MDIWVVSTFWLLRTFVYSFLLGIYLRVEFLGYTVNSVFNLLRNCQAVSQNIWKHFYIPVSNVWGFQILYILPKLIIVFLVIVVLVSMKWYNIVVLTCISQMIKNVEHLFKCLLRLPLWAVFLLEWGCGWELICLALFLKCQLSILKYQLNKQALLTTGRE